MIESNILGAAAGVQYQGVIDKSEGTSLPALSNGVIIGRFKRGYTGKVFTVTANSYKTVLGHDPSNPSYMAVADLFSCGVSEVGVLRVGGTGKVTAPPIVPSAVPLRFTTTNNKNGNELTIKINIYSPTDGIWELRESGVKVADSSGFLAPQITIDTSTNSWDLGAKILTLNQSGATKQYELFSKADEITISHSASKVGVGADGILTVESFCSHTPNQNFNVGDVKLTVPDELPRNITTLATMFYGSNLFDQPLDKWDTSNITSGSVAFQGCSAFKGVLGDWDTSNFVNMEHMFLGCESFNGLGIGKWDVSKVLNMDYMFRQTNMAEDLSKWCVTNIKVKPEQFDYLVGWWPQARPVWGTCPRGENVPA